MPCFTACSHRGLQRYAQGDYRANAFREVLSIGPWIACQETINQCRAIHCIQTTSENAELIARVAERIQSAWKTAITGRFFSNTNTLCAGIVAGVAHANPHDILIGFQPNGVLLFARGGTRIGHYGTIVRTTFHNGSDARNERDGKAQDDVIGSAFSGKTHRFTRRPGLVGTGSKLRDCMLGVSLERLSSRINVLRWKTAHVHGHENCVGRGSQPATPPWCEQHPRLGPLQEHEGEGVPSRHKYMRFSSNSACSSRNAAGSFDFTRFSASTTSGSLRCASGICSSRLRALHTAARIPVDLLSRSSIAAFARSRANSASSTAGFSAGGGAVSTGAGVGGTATMTGCGDSSATRGGAGGGGLAGVGDGDGSNGFAGSGSTAFAAEPRSDCHSDGIQWPSGAAVPHPNSKARSKSKGRGKSREGVRIVTARRYDKSVEVVYAFDACDFQPAGSVQRSWPTPGNCCSDWPATPAIRRFWRYGGNSRGPKPARLKKGFASTHRTSSTHRRHCARYW